MRAAVVQFHAEEGDIATNLSSIVEIIESQRENTELFVFPELALSGYLDDQRAPKAALSADSDAFKELQKATKGVGAVIGFIEQGENDQILNSAAYFEDGKLVQIQRKIVLVDYGKFKETDYFTCGNQIQVFQAMDYKAAILICNDAWHPELTVIASLQGAELLFVPAAAAFDGLAGFVENTRAWKQIISTKAMLFGSYVLFANYAGKRKDRAAFLGNSSIVDPHGQTIAGVSANCRGCESALIQKELINDMRDVLPISKRTRVEMILDELERVHKQSRSSEGG